METWPPQPRRIMTLAPLSPEQRNVVNYLCSNEDHVFITGKAGTGKTHVLRWFKRMTNREVVVCAPTGIAALNAQGATLHNLVGLGTSTPGDLGVDAFKNRMSKKYLRTVDAIVIDEVSMVSSAMMDATDRLLQDIRENNEPFGGLQIIMFGDIYQLPPVVPKDDRAYYEWENYRSEWFFDAKVWEDSPFETFALSQVHRQAAGEFVDLLNGVRDGSIDQSGLDQLNYIGMNNPLHEHSMLLGTRKKIVEDLNIRNLSKLPGSYSQYQAMVNTGFGRMEPAERTIKVKPGARIMMLSNERTGRWVNGSMGTLTSAGDSMLTVDLDDGTTANTVDRHAWVKAGTHPMHYQDAPKYRQFPLRLAWGVTIHKSQGLSLDHIDIDLGTGAFSPGQTYVALSRVTSPEGFHLQNPITRRDIQVDPHVKRFFQEL